MRLPVVLNFRGMVLAGLLIAWQPVSGLAWQQASPPPAPEVVPAGGIPTEANSSEPKAAPRVLAPQGAQPISPDAAQRSEPATVLIQDSSPPTQRASRSATQTTVAETPAGASPTTAEPEIEAASLKGVQPGVTTKDQVRAVWGAPKREDRYPQHEEHLHQMEPFEQVVVAYQRDTVTTIVVHLKTPLKSDLVRSQLGMHDLDPALVYDPAGKLLGQVFPERGVLFSFQPGAPELLVKQIVLEGVHPRPFAIRAEGRLVTHWTRGLKDIEQALKLDPKFARAHWLKAQLLTACGRLQEAMRSADEAVRLDDSNVEYRLTRAKLFFILGDSARASSESKIAMAHADTPLLKARVLSLMADLTASGGNRDLAAAVQQRQQVVELLDPLLAEGGAAVAPARELLLEAHLGTAHDIAWGPWDRKAEVVPKWLAEAGTISEEDHPLADVARQRKLRIARAALGALAGLHGEVDPTPWIETMETVTKEAVAGTDDTLRQGQLQWDFALANYDAMQIYHARGDSSRALRYGNKLQEVLAKVVAIRGKNEECDYLLGRTYFRTGAVYAVLKSSHSQAIAWYDKALPLVKEMPSTAAANIGRHGESLVSMGVSYWEAGQRAKAVELTSLGLSQMQKAVANGLLEETALGVPYGNLAQMHRRLGDLQSAGKFAQLASRSQNRLK